MIPMQGLRRAACLSGFLLIAACTQQAQRAFVHFIPGATGLAVPEAGQRIDFGRSPEGVIAALDREVGPGRELPLVGCPESVARQIDWQGLVLSFSRERFIGWRSGNQQAGQTCF
ncbi:MAG: hypothetical protein P8X50_06635 [Maritimibacter sp.]